MSEDSLRRVTEGWGELVEEQRKAEAKQVYAEEKQKAVERVVKVHMPIQGQGNVSSDGDMVLLRAEGWKEVKMSVFSQAYHGPLKRVNSKFACAHILSTMAFYG